MFNREIDILQGLQPSRSTNLPWDNMHERYFWKCVCERVSGYLNYHVKKKKQTKCKGNGPYAIDIMQSICLNWYSGAVTYYDALLLYKVWEWTASHEVPRSNLTSTSCLPPGVRQAPFFQPLSSICNIRKIIFLYPTGGWRGGNVWISAVNTCKCYINPDEGEDDGHHFSLQHKEMCCIMCKNSYYFFLLCCTRNRILPCLFPSQIVHNSLLNLDFNCCSGPYLQDLVWCCHCVCVCQHLPAPWPFAFSWCNCAWLSLVRQQYLPLGNGALQNKMN